MLTWDAVVNTPDLAGYEVRYGDDWDLATSIHSTGITQQWVPAPAGGATTVYRVRAVNQTGLYSANDATVTVTTPSPPPSMPTGRWGIDFGKKKFPKGSPK